MKGITFVLLIAFCCSASAGIRLSNGQLVSEGDSPAKLIRALGAPVTKSYVNEWCDRKKESVCVREQWVYFLDDKQWTITIFQNEIVDMDWTRR